MVKKYPIYSCEECAILELSENLTPLFLKCNFSKEDCERRRGYVNSDENEDQ